jgi:two-component system NtrC family response regulator
VPYHTGRLCESYGIPAKGFSPEFFDSLLAYDWPGNVRELINTLDRALAAARHEPTLYPTHLPSNIRIKVARTAVLREEAVKYVVERSSGMNSLLPKLRDFRENAVAQAEKQYLTELMSLVDFDIREACKVSDLSQPRLYALLKKHNITRGSRFHSH